MVYVYELLVQSVTVWFAWLFLCYNDFISLVYFFHNIWFTAQIWSRCYYNYVMHYQIDASTSKNDLQKNEGEFQCKKFQTNFPHYIVGKNNFVYFGESPLIELFLTPYPSVCKRSKPNREITIYACITISKEMLRKKRKKQQ